MLSLLLATRGLFAARLLLLGTLVLLLIALFSLLGALALLLAGFLVGFALLLTLLAGLFLALTAFCLFFLAAVAICLGALCIYTDGEEGSHRQNHHFLHSGKSVFPLTGKDI